MSGDGWSAFEYETKMFYGTAKRRREKESSSVVVENAIVESELLHIRILSEFLSGRSRKDDVPFETLLPLAQRPSQLEAAVKELDSGYGTRSNQGSPCWELNKRLAHLTKHRGDRYDYAQLFATMEPLLHTVLSQVAKVAGRPQLIEYVGRGKLVLGTPDNTPLNPTVAKAAPAG